jgi:hypothetical protein
VGLSEDKARWFAAAVGRDLLNAFRSSDGPPVLTLLRQRAVRLTAHVAACWTDMRANPPGPIVGIVVDIDASMHLGQVRRCSPQNAGYFARLAERNDRHFT